MKTTSRRNWIQRACLWAVGATLAYLLMALVGLIPANRGFQSTENGIPLTVYAGPVHCDLILPIRNEVIDWRDHFPAGDFIGNVSELTHVSIGWGDRGFYLETPRWRDLKVGTVCRAVFTPSPTVMHVQFQYEPVVSDRQRRVFLSKRQYEILVGQILSSLKTSENHSWTLENGSPRDGYHLIDFHYSDTDAFYEASGSYHAFNTCNCWAADTLQAVGVCVPRFSPFPGSVLMYFPNPDDE